MARPHHKKMETIRTYIQVLETTTEIALATSVDNVPNVRIVSYIFDEKQPGVLYFATEGISPKAAEMLLNKHVAFTTIPREGAAHIRSHKATVKKSALSFNDMKALFIKEVDGYAETVAAIGDELDVFEVHTKEAVIVTGYEEPVKIVFNDIE